MADIKYSDFLVCADKWQDALSSPICPFRGLQKSLPFHLHAVHFIYPRRFRLLGLGVASCYLFRAAGVPRCKLYWVTVMQRGFVYACFNVSQKRPVISRLGFLDFLLVIILACGTSAFS